MLGMSCWLLVLMAAQPLEESTFADEVTAFLRAHDPQAGQELADSIKSLSSAGEIPHLWRVLDFTIEDTSHRYSELRRVSVDVLCRLGDDRVFRDLVLSAQAHFKLLSDVANCAVRRGLQQLPAQGMPKRIVLLDPTALPDELNGLSPDLQRAYLRYKTLMTPWEEANAKAGEDGHSDSALYDQNRADVLEGDLAADWQDISSARFFSSCGNGAAALFFAQRTSMLIALLRERNYPFALAAWLDIAPARRAGLLLSGPTFGFGEWMDGFLRLAAAAGEPPDELLLGAILHDQPDYLVFFASLATPQRGQHLSELAHYFDLEEQWIGRTNLLSILSPLRGDAPPRGNFYTAPFYDATRFDLQITPLDEDLQLEFLQLSIKWALRAPEREPYISQPDSDYGELAAQVFLDLKDPLTRPALERLAKWKSRTGKWARKALSILDGPVER